MKRDLNTNTVKTIVKRIGGSNGYPTTIHITYGLLRNNIEFALKNVDLSLYPNGFTIQEFQQLIPEFMQGFINKQLIDDINVEIVKMNSGK